MNWVAGIIITTDKYGNFGIHRGDKCLVYQFHSFGDAEIGTGCGLIKIRSGDYERISKNEYKKVACRQSLDAEPDTLLTTKQNNRKIIAL